ncbi:MAG: cytochrome d ubiquinol oxidase subunit II [Cutibacterium avidum]|nr:cytochrome d ubiquinol oxidase subunit II [Cutibacterium avidum]MDU3282618.1 cytochrome d ubiquinol oxidase subunit II [Cutibacterium avidum]MDU3748917.1 cytochrome d ubiquinol oxidase subunit II [Cutibacterium avidum]
MLPVLETAAHSPLTIVWFVLITVLWVGFFFLEGFDFGVAMLLPFMGRDDKDRRLMVNTIGPTWDGNEVWLLTAGGATFAAFPGWYATMFSGLYLPLLLVLLGLIIRGVSFEYRSKHPSSKWRNTFDWMATIGSFLPTLVLGVGFANFVRGLAVGPHPTPDGGVAPLVTTSFWGLFTPFALIGGILFVVLFCAHGANFVALKTLGDMHDRARKTSAKLGWIATAVALVWALMFNIMYVTNDGRQVLTWILGLLVVVLLAAGSTVVAKGREGLAFLCTGLGIALMIVASMIAMYGNLGYRPSGIPFDMWIASSTPYTLKIMTISACIFVPIVLAYQIWSYWVFRKRLTREAIPDTAVAA